MTDEQKKSRYIALISNNQSVMERASDNIVILNRLIEEIPEPEPERTYRIGDVFNINGANYVLLRAGIEFRSKVRLTNPTDGEWYTFEGSVEDENKITRIEIDDLVGVDWTFIGDFDKVYKLRNQPGKAG